MINHALRYMPIIDLLPVDCRNLLEVGAGTTGIGAFLQRRFIGCDVVFEHRPVAPMLPVCSSVLELPFTDAVFDCVIASDMMEHIPPPNRVYALNELLRVAQHYVIIGFPCGTLALDNDRELATFYKKTIGVLPSWLEEHLAYGLPEEEWLEDCLKSTSWQVISYGNENIERRIQVLRWESRRFNRAISWEVSRRVPHSLLSKFAWFMSRYPPYYRRIYLIRRSL